MDKAKKDLSPNDFKLIAEENRGDIESETVRPSISFRKETWLMLVHNKIAVLFLGILCLIIIGAVFFPVFSPFDFATQNVAFANKPFFSRDPLNGYIHIFGTDHLGRDIFIRIWYGARVSLMVAAVVAVIDCVIGLVYGCISGYIGGRVDEIMMRLLEVISGIPYLVVVLLLMAVLPQGVVTLIVAYALVGWTGMARLIRGQVRSLSNREFMIAARIMGSGIGRIIFCHLIPNLMGVIIVNMTLDIPQIIFTEAFLSMLGMGVSVPYPSLGIMANEGVAVFQTYPARLAVPGIIICLIMLSFNLLGDQLQDALDPKLRRKFGHGKRTGNK